MARQLILLTVLLCLALVPASASSITAGFISLDIFIPAGPGPGINSLDIYDLTGPAWGPVAGTPYVATAVVLDNAILTLNVAGGSPVVFMLGNLMPGELLDNSGDPVLQFPSTEQFTSAKLTATLSTTSLMLSDGTTFSAEPTIMVTMTPASGNVLVPGVDFALIDVVSSGIETPEPSTLTLFCAGLLAIGLAAAYKRRQSVPRP